jgi:hypothetical protein
MKMGRWLRCFLGNVSVQMAMYTGQGEQGLTA